MFIPELRKPGGIPETERALPDLPLHYLHAQPRSQRLPKYSPATTLCSEISIRYLPQITPTHAQEEGPHLVRAFLPYTKA